MCMCMCCVSIYLTFCIRFWCVLRIRRAKGIEKIVETISNLYIVSVYVCVCIEVCIKEELQDERHKRKALSI